MVSCLKLENKNKGSDRKREENKMKKFINDIEFEAVESNDQSDTFTIYHARYEITLIRLDICKEISFDYQCNPDFTTPNKEDCLYAFLSDAQAYEYCNDDIDIFASETGLTKVSECLKAFDACKKAFYQLKDFCGSDAVYEGLKEYFTDY